MSGRMTAVVLAAGRGSRMKSETAKQYMELLGKPVLYYALRAFEESLAVQSVVLVVAEDEEVYVTEAIVKRFHLHKVAAVVCGGAQRQDSVYRGLLAAADAEYVMIHDGARPLVTPALIARLAQAVEETNACVAGVPVKDTIKRVSQDGTVLETPARETLWQIQTPQAFSYALILDAYETVRQQTLLFTDDASVLEYARPEQPIRIVQGAYENIKLTTPEDLLLAEALLAGSQE